MNFASAKQRVTHLADPFYETKTGKFIKRLLLEAATDDVSGLSAEMAYRMLLALFPFFIFMAAMAGFVTQLAGVDDPTQKIMDQIGTALPEDARSVLQGQLRAILESHNVGLISFGAIGAAWGATSAMSTMVKALNRAYDVEETRPFWKRVPMELGLTALLMLFVIGSFVILLLGQVFASEIGNWIGLEGFARSAFALLRFPIAIVLLSVAMAFIYWAAPNVDIPLRWVSPGALAFIVSWIAASVGFSSYVSHFGSYQSTYGTLGGVIVLLIWLNITSLLMMVGAEINAIIQANAAPHEMKGTIAKGHRGI